MLNELYELSQALEKYGQLQSTTHPNVSNIGKGHTLLIALDQQGLPKEIRLLQKDETALLWKHSKGNHNSFPAIRVKKPLLQEIESNKQETIQWKKLKSSEKREWLLSLDFSAVNSACQDIKISEWSLAEFKVLEQTEQPELCALQQLVSVFPREEEALPFIRQLLDFLVDYIPRCQDDTILDLLKDLLVGSKDKMGKYVANCMTYYDVYEVSEYVNLVSSPATRAALVTLLNQYTSAEEESGQIVSPLTGAAAAGVGAKYPNPNLPILGLTYLYSKKADIPCLTRYTLSGAEAYQIGKTDSDAMNDAVAFLTAKERNGISWSAITDSNRDKPDLLLAYLADDPQNEALLAKVLRGIDADEQEGAAAMAFEKLCQQVIGSLESVQRKNPRSKINMILLETLDPGRKQVVYESSWTTEQFCQNLFNWQEAAQNYPPIFVKIKVQKASIRYEPLCLGPDEICRLLKINYSRTNPLKPSKHSLVSLHEIYQIYMPQNMAIDQSELLTNILEHTLVKGAKLLGDLGGEALKQAPASLEKSYKEQARQGMQFVSLLAILLWRLGIRKETYMMDIPYNLGQFLKLADMLHKEYCIRVRNNGDNKKMLPAQLMGNEMLNIACEEPIEAVNRLRERMKIYLSWAETAVGENIGLVKWVLARMSEVSLLLGKQELPERFTPAQQAQVLFGYLAAVPYEKKTAAQAETAEEIKEVE